MNVIAQQAFELVYYDVTVKYIDHNAKLTLPWIITTSFIWYKCYFIFLKL